MAEDNLRLSPLSQSEINEAREEFQTIDLDRNGTLEENELDSYFRQSKDINKQSLRCFSKLICSIYGQQGKVSFDQYLKFYTGLTVDRDDENYIGRHIFEYIDTDKSGTIESEEFQKVVDLIKFPEGHKQSTVDKVDEMDYEAFSKQFYTILRMAWKRTLGARYA